MRRLGNSRKAWLIGMMVVTALCGIAVWTKASSFGSGTPRYGGEESYAMTSLSYCHHTVNYEEEVVEFVAGTFEVTSEEIQREEELGYTVEPRAPARAVLIINGVEHEFEPYDDGKGATLRLVVPIADVLLPGAELDVKTYDADGEQLHGSGVTMPIW